MGGAHRSIGFLENINSLTEVDEDFKGLILQSYYIPGFGSYGVSCSGHYREYPSEAHFRPRLFGHLGFDALPELDHIKELFLVLNNEVLKDSDARIRLEGKGAPSNWPKYSSEVDLLKNCSCKTKLGLARLHLEISIGDRGILDSFEDTTGQLYYPIKGNELIVEQSKLRLHEIQFFWKNLENVLIDFNKTHNFTSPVFDKLEFYMR
jgi:hypothetical protein